MSNEWRFKLEPSVHGAPLLTILEAPDNAWDVRRVALMAAQARTPEDERRDLLAAAVAYDSHAHGLEREAARLHQLASEARAQAMILRTI